MIIILNDMAITGNDKYDTFILHSVDQIGDIFKITGSHIILLLYYKVTHCKYKCRYNKSLQLSLFI